MCFNCFEKFIHSCIERHISPACPIDRKEIIELHINTNLPANNRLAQIQALFIQAKQNIEPLPPNQVILTLENEIINRQQNLIELLRTQEDAFLRENEILINNMIENLNADQRRQVRYENLYQQVLARSLFSEIALLRKIKSSFRSCLQSQLETLQVLETFHPNPIIQERIQSLQKRCAELEAPFLWQRLMGFYHSIRSLLLDLFSQLKIFWCRQFSHSA